MKTLYIDIDEDIADILRKVGQIKGKQLLLVIPKGAAFFENPVHLKLLKKKTDEESKEIQVFTNDEKGQKMLSASGLKLYQGHLRKRKQLPSAQIDRLPKEVAKQQGKRISITEVSEKSRKQNAQTHLSGPNKKRQRKDQKQWVTFFHLNTLRKKTVLSFTAVAVLFFALVVYIAVPSATIYLTPASNVLETTVNVIFADAQTNEQLFRDPNAHSIPVLPLDLSFEKSLLYQSTGRVFTGSLARCNIKISNLRTSPWTLVPKTRFKDNSGIVFRTSEKIEVPAARFQVITDEEGNPTREKVPGSLIINVVADEFDENKNIIGARGNLPAHTKFFLPGLSPFNQTLLSGENETPCQGGVTEYYSIVTADDLEAAQEKIKQEMEASAREYLVDYIDGENVRRAEKEKAGESISRIALFDHPQVIQYEVLEISLPPDLKEGEKVDEFSVAGSMKVKGLAYEKQRLFELLEQGLLSRVHPQKVLSRVDFESITQNIVYSDSDLDSLEKVKVSVTVRGVEEYNFDPRSPEGKEVVSRILNYIPAKTDVDAHYFIANLEEIQKAHISIWPFWKNDLPTRPSSITIKVQ